MPKLDRSMIPINLALSIALASSAAARADSWSPPKPKQVTSKDGTYRLSVEPAFLAAQSSEKGADGKPAPKKAKGKLERKGEGGRFATVWEHPLTNDVSPVGVLVADDGTVVTTDNWHSVGYGSNVVVIYAPDGKLIRSMGLEDFMTKEEMGRATRSVSSIWWGNGHNFDDRQENLILKIGNDGRPWGKDPGSVKEISVRLKTGEIVAEAKGKPQEAPKP